MQSTLPAPLTENLLLLVGVGYEKCGTTTLARQLARDQRFAVPAGKELFFFNEHYSESLDDYLAQFPIGDVTTAIVDITPSYIRSAAALQRLRTTKLRKKIIVCMRDPIQRAYSHYVHNIYYHHAHYDQSLKANQTTSLYEHPYSLSFREALEQRDGFVRSLYYDEIKHLFSTFDRDDILIMILERDFSVARLNSRLSEFTGMNVTCEAVVSENVGGRLPIIIGPEEDFQITNGQVSAKLLKGNLYIFLSKQHGIAYWENVTQDLINRAIEASNRWSTYVSPLEVLDLREEHFAKDIANIEELVGYELPEWKVQQPLLAKKWLGIGRLKCHTRDRAASESVFSSP